MGHQEIGPWFQGCSAGLSCPVFKVRGAEPVGTANFLLTLNAKMPYSLPLHPAPPWTHLLNVHRPLMMTIVLMMRIIRTMFVEC